MISRSSPLHAYVCTNLFFASCDRSGDGGWFAWCVQWAALVFAYLFTLHALYVLRGEYQVFSEMREDYLTRGDPDFSPQTLYTTKVG